jgi:hypothetical protein
VKDQFQNLQNGLNGLNVHQCVAQAQIVKLEVVRGAENVNLLMDQANVVVLIEKKKSVVIFHANGLNGLHGKKISNVVLVAVLMVLNDELGHVQLMIVAMEIQKKQKSVINWPNVQQCLAAPK